MHDIKNTKIPNKINDLANFSGFSYITRAGTYACACMRVYTGAGARMQVGAQERARQRLRGGRSRLLYLQSWL